ncbi:MAG TPA: glycosyl hydrolase family 18 protein [Myxococcota bacterium]|nr:glycosyl hydrolase family 18 protein [Myxococcota bacterium]HRY93905.1 glycosyl hydrolase family 18 protein [Myxococcota bacterium]HSA23990.1 glycosyl hydrolase family 18 protein [Myxococcota bacterium]
MAPARVGLPTLLVLLSGLAWAPPAPAADRARPAARPALPPERIPSIHELELRLHQGESAPPSRAVEPGPLARGRPRAVQRVVYGYYPYWAHDLDSLRWTALTHLAWFSLEMNASGVVTAWHGWPDTATVQAAHAAGVRVDLCFTLFDAAGIRSVVNSAANRATAVTSMLDELQAGGADGVSVDFEGVPADARDGFATFICELRQGMDARGLTDAQISIAGPAVDWSDVFDLGVLLDCADYYFIMGYDYFWGGSTRAGPSGILRTTADWRPYAGYSELRSVAYYTSMVPAARRAQILLGVPYYGREWTTTSGDMAAATIDNVRSVTYAAAMQDLAGGRERLWHAGIRAPWYRWQESGTWHEVYHEDEESLAAKFQLVNDQDLGGAGMWALNYDVGHSALWDLLEQAFGQSPAAPPGHRLNPLPIGAFPFHDARDTSQGPSNYFNHYSCNQELAEWGREWVYQLDLCQPGHLSATVPDEPAADPDLHLLSAPDQDACLARAHTALEADLQPGRYWLVVDTYVDNAVELEGPFTLDVAFTPDPGSQPCEPGQTCQEGVCQGSGEEPGSEEEPGFEEEGPQDLEDGGQVDGEDGEDAADGPGHDDGAEEDREAEGGCGCASQAPGSAGLLLLLLLAWLPSARRRQRD